MRTTTCILICLLSLIFGQISAQSFDQKFNVLMKKGDTAAQRLLIAEWEKAERENPELFVAKFNYHIKKSLRDVKLYNKAYADSNHLLKDPTKKVNYIQLYDDAELEKGYAAIQNGIDKYPARLDMRLGKIFMLGERQDFKKFTSEIVGMIDYSAFINNKWLWTNNKPADELAIVESVQQYFLKLYYLYTSNENAAELLTYMEMIPLAVLKNYPDRVVSLSNLSIVYLLRKDFEKALEVLLKAEKLKPDDHVILQNIAQTYEHTKEFSEAIRYYELVLKYGDEKAKQLATKKIAELTNKK